MRDSSDELIKRYINQRIESGEPGVWYDKDPGESCSSPVAELESLRGELRECRACPLGETRLNPCFGNGSFSAGIMFIGEGPGFEEDHRGEVFVGRAGKLLDRIIDTMLGMSREDVFITNIVKCHPMKDPSDPEKRGNDRPPAPEELSVCIERFLYRQIELIRPGVIVTLGAPASKTILGSGEGITSLRGKPRRMSFKSHQAIVVPTYHPAYLLRSPSKKRDVFEDFKLIRSLL